MGDLVKVMGWREGEGRRKEREGEEREGEEWLWWLSWCLVCWFVSSFGEFVVMTVGAGQPNFRLGSQNGFVVNRHHSPHSDNRRLKPADAWLLLFPTTVASLGRML